MRRTIYILCWLLVTLSANFANAQSKIEQLESKIAAAAENEKAEIYNQLSQLYYTSDAQKSLSSANNALKSAIATKDIGSEAKAHINIGLANYKLKNYSEAIGSYKAALAIYEKHNSVEGMAYIYIQMGATYSSMKNSSSAVTYFQKSFDSYKSLNNNQGLSRSLMSMGDALVKQGKTKNALIKYKEAIPYYKAGNDNQGLAYAYNKIGATYSNFGNYEEAKTMLTKAMSIAKSSNMSNLSNDISRNLKIVEDNIKSAVEGKSEFAKAEEEAVSEKIQELEVKSSQFEEKTSDFLQKIGALDEEAKLAAMLVKIKEDALKQEKMLKDKKAQELELLTKEKEIDDAKHAASAAANKAEIEKKNTIAFGLVGGLVFLAAIAFLILARYQQKKKANNLLEQQNKEIKEQKEEISGQKSELETQKAQLEKTNRQMSDSIDYAKRIQSALLSSKAKIQILLPEFLLLFKPKSVVSGDFYWIREKNGKVLFAAADCTGHGVPGAFMSIISNNVLNDIISKHSTTNPGEILKLASDSIIDRLQDKEAQVVESSDGTKTEWEVKDGMDIALCALDRSTLKLQYAGAHNPLYIVRNGELIEYRGDRLFIGNTDETTVFKTHDVQLQKGDMIYVFSDGFADQRGGPDNKKFYYKPFQDMLIEYSQKSMDEQQSHYDKVITEWMGTHEQIDDIIIFGVKV